MSAIATAIVVGGVGGSMVSANAAKKAQQGANAANASLAERQSQDAYNAWLTSRGLSAGTNGLPAAGTAVNTSLPLWSTINGQPAEQYLLNKVLNTSGVISRNDAASKAEQDFASKNPGAYAWWQDYRKQTGSTANLFDLMRDYYAKNPGDTPNAEEAAALAAADEYDANNAKAVVPAEYDNLQKSAVASAGRIFDGGYLNDELSALAPALAARRAAADLGFARNNEMRARVGDIYDAEMLGADTYGNSAMDAVSRVLAENRAKRALQGFSGGSSFDDLTRARTLAPALNAGAMARATAGVNKAKSLSGILDTDVQIGQQNADLQNAIDRLQLISGDISRKIGASNLPAQLYSNKVQMDNLASDARFTDIDATLKRLGLFTSNNSTPPTPTYAQVQPAITGGQIAGQAISSTGQALANYWGTQSLLNAMNGGGVGSTYKGIPVANTPATASTGKWW